MNVSNSKFFPENRETVEIVVNLNPDFVVYGHARIPVYPRQNYSFTGYWSVSTVLVIVTAL